MKYLDFHQHYGLLEYRATKVLYAGDHDQAFERLILENCKKLDMIVAINGSGLHSGRYLINKNDEVEIFFKKNPEYIIGVGYVDLDYDTPAYIDNLYKRGFKAIKAIFPSERYDSKKYFGIYKRCEFYSLPILFHSGIVATEFYNGKEGVCSYNMHPLFLEGVSLNFPRLQIVGAHLGTGNYATACALADTSRYSTNNIRFDISAADHYREKIKEGNFIKKDIPVGNVIWGLDEPPTRYEEIINDWHKYFDKIGLTSEEKEMIFYKNACGILNIKY